MLMAITVNTAMVIAIVVLLPDDFCSSGFGSGALVIDLLPGGFLANLIRFTIDSFSRLWTCLMTQILHMC